MDVNAPTYFGMKFISVYLAEDVNNVTYNNIGKIGTLMKFLTIFRFYANDLPESSM